MKLNITNILNQIAAEEATVVILNDPEASWNQTSEQSLRDAYDWYKEEAEWRNDDTWDLIEWLDKHNRDYSHLHIDKVLSYDEWYNTVACKYLIAA